MIYFGSTGISTVRYLFKLFFGQVEGSDSELLKRDLHSHTDLSARTVAIPCAFVMKFECNILMLQMLCMHTDW